METVLLGSLVSPYDTVTHVRDKNSYIQERSPYVVKMIFRAIRNCF